MELFEIICCFILCLLYLAATLAKNEDARFAFVMLSILHIGLYTFCFR